VKPASFVYHAPRTLDEAIQILGEVAPEDGRVLAGGQSLVPTMAFRLARPAHLVDINAVAKLDRLAADNDELAIGACVRHAAFHRAVVGGPLGELLAFVVRHIAHYPIRVRGTFCGSLAHADPASEWCLVAAALGGKMIARNTRGMRTIPASDFFQGMMTTALDEDEILIETRLPMLAPDIRWGFYEFSRRAGDYALAMALVTFRIEDRSIADPCVALGGAEALPRRISEAETVLAGAAPQPEAFRRAAEAAADCIEPLEDIQADAVYRRDLVRAVTRRALERATG
jgi:carbon-monoxide dehydrogenase medium subunit